jgi:hypothetical protein
LELKKLVLKSWKWLPATFRWSEDVGKQELSGKIRPSHNFESAV